MAVRARRLWAVLIAVLSVAMLSAGLQTPVAAVDIGAGVGSAKSYEVCWWRVDAPADSYECRSPFKGPTGAVDIPTGTCWTSDQQGGLTQNLQQGQWVDLPSVGVQYKPSIYCQDPEIPFASYVRWKFKAATMAKTQLRFLVPFEETTDISAATVVCVRLATYRKMCRY